LVLSMEEPSTIRRAETDMGRAPYGGDSLEGQTDGRLSRGLMEQCTLFVLSSQYVLKNIWILALSVPFKVNGPFLFWRWPDLKISP